LVVGAGISGLLAAGRLQDAGISAIVLDKGRGVGGRMSTRRIGKARIDHGAQFFTASEDSFRERVQGWAKDGVVLEWVRGFAGPGGDVRTGVRPAFRGITGMSAIPKHLARGLKVLTACRVTRIEREFRGYRAVTEDGEVHRGRAVLLTAPVPQSLALLEAGGVELRSAAEDLLHAIEYDPCFAVLAVLSGPSAVPEPGGIMLGDGPIAWIADNTRKGISPTEGSAITIHATADYTRSRLEMDGARVGEELLDAAGEWLGSEVREVQVHRWLYSLPKNRPGEPFLAVDDDCPLVFAGDAFGGASVEGAALSGLAAGEWLSAASH
jgi:predicted NAD/FAD-dependent oxidoreductase